MTATPADAVYAFFGGADGIRFVKQSEKQGGRTVNAIVDRIPAVSQEATWTWWNKP